MNKTKRIEIRLTIFEEKLIKIKAKEAGLSASEYIRKSALDKPIPKALDSEELEVYHDLKKFYNNFSAISNLFRRGDHNKMIQEIDDLKLELKKHLNRIYDQ